MAMEMELKALKASRGYSKAGISRLQNFLSNPTEVQNTPTLNLSSRKDKLGAIFREYEDYNKKILCLDPSDQEIENTEEIENKYFHLLTLLNEEINKRQPESETIPSQAKLRTKLPTININTFTGKYAEYVNFISLFKSLIDSDRSLDKVQKLHYLRSFVKDEPYDLIKNLPLTSESYNEALRLLDNRYFNKFRIVTEHVNELLDLGSMAKSTSGCIREFVSSIKQSLSSLKNLGVKVGKWDPILICLLTRKLDAYTGRAYQLERNQSTEPSIAELMEFLENRALALENSEPPSRESKLWKPKVAVHLTTEAKVKVFGKDGKEVHVRAILDSGSQISLLTSKAVDVLGFTPTETNTNIIGIANTKNNAKFSIPLEVHSLKSSFSTSITFCVVDRITCKLPQNKLDLTSFKIPPNIELADKDFHVPGEINMLIGSDVFFQLLLPSACEATQTSHAVQANKPTQSQRTAQAKPSCRAAQADQGAQANQATSPILINTVLGTVIAGTLPEPNVANVVSLFCTKCESDISQTMTSFLDTEKVPQYLSEKSNEQDIVENIFQSTVQLKNNKFTVDLPLKVPPSEVNDTLGESFDLALYRFLSLEKRLHKNINLLTEYTKIIDSYTELGHAHYMDISSYSKSEPTYYMPHFAVTNENSDTTPTRIVFDGSMKTKKGISLNDIIMNGPVVQRDLFDVILLYRFGDYTFTTDIKKMFRSIQLNPEHTSLQNILWRDNPNKPIRCLRLDTVTFGLKSSSYLATRCLYELANRYEAQWPLASFIIKNCTYVDDVCYSNTNLDMLCEAKDQLRELLKVASLETHKWASNNPNVLEGIPSTKQMSENLDLQKVYTVKTLGLTIDVKRDCFTLQCPEPLAKKLMTKREILSYISKIYDPLGFVGPIVVKAKEFMKRVWSEKLNWNDTPSQKLTSDWSQFTNNLAAMKPIHLNRNIPIPYSATVQLIGFSDASSTTAYGCCVYLRVVQQEGEAKLYLLCSKSRINPSAKPLTIPRLELNACLLLSNLIAKVYETLSIKVKIDDTYLFSDSKIALAWINTEPTKLQAYVANRVKVVQQLTTRWRWLYVQTQDNPADLVSRGVDPHQLSDCSSWWSGPSFLYNREYKFETTEGCLPCNDNLPEMKLNSKFSETVNKTVLLAQIQTDFFRFLDKFSKITKMKRVLAFVLRFCHNTRSNNNRIVDKCLSSGELDKALLIIIKHEQQIHYQNDLETLLKGNIVRGNLKPLCPFIDQEGLMRVSGRLQNSDLPFDQKHPIILPKESRITSLIIQHEHIRLLHAGPKLLLSSLNQRYWLVNGIRQVKKITHKCLTCFRCKATAAKQLMGSLPRQRVTVSRPFQAVGVDFAGPIMIKNSRVRRAIISKGYICLYVCFTTKAIHLELVSDLTTETFLACFKRFISRRGIPSEVFCDNAATFRCAGSQLVELFKLNNSQDHRTQVCDFSSQQGIKFHFTPSYSPVFAGLAEAGVKSTKYHLKRVTQNSSFTYEQLNTILNQVEAVVNSRPLLPVTSSSLTDFAYLTPGHFLIGVPLTSFPQKDLSETPDNRLKFWQLIEKTRQGFWKTWSRNYLNILQSRPKWSDSLPNLTIGTLVILREPNVPPLNWPMGRIVKVFPGGDGKVRAFEVAAPNGKIYKRSLSGICPLPLLD